MRINNNISALNTHSRLNAANNSKAGSLAKLSSGLRINKAGDDAAGLAISEKMRGQIGGLKQATRNAQDGISLIQTAEGALNETHSILNRMRELAVQSANDTNTESDRGEIQKEMDQLAIEVTRISENTEFNTKKLLNGELEGKGNELTFHIGSNFDQNLKLGMADMGADKLGVGGNEKANFKVKSDVVDLDNTGHSLEDGKSYDVVELPQETDIAAVAGSKYALKDGDNIIGHSNDGKEWTLLKGTDNTDISTKKITLDHVVTSGKLTADNTTGTSFTLEGIASAKFENKDVALKAGNYQVQTTGVAATTSFQLVDTDTNTVVAKSNGTVDTGSDTEIEWITAEDSKALMKTSILADESNITIEAAGIDVSSQASADKAITTIDDAILAVSAERSKLGATQNRLDHTINNLTATAENLSEAESRIRDVDMAEEMMEFTKNNILSQAATSMLAQANQMPQSVLQLLQ